jgi:tryptophanyl-tRNA synthetase
MSKSLDNTINITASAGEIQKRLMTAYTDPKKIRLKDPGNPQGCVIFAYQKKFDNENIETIEADCRGGKLGCVAHKKAFAAALIKWLEPIRERRAYFESHKNEVEDIIADGDKRARCRACETMEMVREAMRMG